MNRTMIGASIAVALSAQAMAQGDLYLSMADNIGVEVGGTGAFTDEDVFRTGLDGTGATTFFSIASGDLDAFHILSNGNYLVSSLFNGNIGGTVFDDADLIEYDPNTGMIVGNYLGIGQGSFTTSSPDISAVTTDEAGNLYFSVLGNTTMNHAGGSLSFTDGDIVMVDAMTGVASIFLSEADIFDDGDGDVYGLHWMGDGTLLMSGNEDEAVGGTTFLDGDVFQYDIATGAASLFFSEANFTDTSNGHDIDAIYFQVPAPGSLALLGLGGVFAARRRR